MNTRRIPFIVSIVTICFQNVVGWRSYIIEIDSIRYEADRNTFRTLSMDLIESDSRNKINGSFSFVEDMKKIVLINWLKSTINRGSKNLYNVTLDACQFLDKSMQKVNPFYAGLLKLLQRFIPEIPSKCPMKKNQIYSLRNFYYNEEVFPPFLPELNFSTVFGMLHKNKYAFKIFITGHVEEKKKF
ncbi:uncharacterized protein LOC142242869 [Haematobia irritans]|uniref:uncharacterized protein LOC142242869 n=1 Tax=Haematobia irritans TaxID=7368 RepID=UPI003F50BBAF